MKQHRLLGAMLLFGGLLSILGLLGWLRAAQGEGEISAQAFGFFLLMTLALMLPLMSGGIYLLVHGDLDLDAYQQSRRTRQLRSLLRQSGELRVVDAMQALELDRADLRTLLAEAARSGLVEGYVDWHKGRLVVISLAQGVLPCPACQARLSLQGRGAVACPYCSADLLLSQGPDREASAQAIMPPPGS
jgi:hypothetical protein